MLRKHALHPERSAKLDIPADPEKLVNRALEFWGNPPISEETRGVLTRFATKAMAAAVADEGRQTVYGGSAALPGLLDDGIARAADSARGKRVLVSVFLPGGADSLSVLAPVGDPRYRRLRPGLALKPGDGPALHGDGRLHWHPSLAPFARLHSQGKLSVMPAIGYAHPDQSHFTSRHY